MKKTLRDQVVLALGGDLTLISVLRVLSRAGARPIAIPDPGGVATRSRYYRAGPAGLAGVTPATLATALECVTPGTVLMACSDVWVHAVGMLPPALNSRYPASCAPTNAIETLVDKARFDATMTRLGLPHALSVANVTLDDLDSVPDEILASSFLKPAHSQEFFAQFGVKAFRVRGRREAAEQLSRCIEAGHSMLLQEYIGGPATAHQFIDGFIDRDGRTKARFARRRLRMYPPEFGNSSISESIELRDVADGAATLDTLFGDLKYRGVFSAEFKFDERTGRMKLLEVNARPWWYVDFAARCGVDVCTLAVLDALGEPVPSIEHYAVGKRCVYPYYDIQAAYRDWSEGKLGIAAWARSWIGAYQPLFTWADPWPAISSTGALIWRRLRK